jgi:hypothetical protein
MHVEAKAAPMARETVIRGLHAQRKEAVLASQYQGLDRLMTIILTHSSLKTLPTLALSTLQI